MPTCTSSPASTRQGDHLDPEAEEEHEQQDPDAVQDGRELRLRAGLDVGRRPHDDARHRQAAEQARRRVLARPCPTSSRSRLARGPVCSLSVATAQSSDSTLATAAIVMPPIRTALQCSAPGHAANCEAAAEAALQVDPLDVEAEQDRRGGRRHYRDERGRDRRQRTRHPLPRQQQGDGRQAEEGRRRVQVHQLGGQRPAGSSGPGSRAHRRGRYAAEPAQS